MTLSQAVPVHWLWPMSCNSHNLLGAGMTMTAWARAWPFRWLPSHCAHRSPCRPEKVPRSAPAPPESRIADKPQAHRDRRSGASPRRSRNRHSCNHRWASQCSVQARSGDSGIAMEPSRCLTGPAAFGLMSKSKICVGTHSVAQALGTSTTPLMWPCTGAVPRIE